MSGFSRSNSMPSGPVREPTAGFAVGAAIAGASLDTVIDRAVATRRRQYLDFSRRSGSEPASGRWRSSRVAYVIVRVRREAPCRRSAHRSHGVLAEMPSVQLRAEGACEFE